MAVPEFDTMPPVVSRSGSLSMSFPCPIGVVKETGRANTSTTHDPTTTQSNDLFISGIKNSHAKARRRKVQEFAQALYEAF
jgi:hypothetical protein